MSNSAQEISALTEERIDTYCDHIQNRIKNCPMELLVRAPATQDECADQSNRLRKILMTAADVATSLWTQRSFIQTIDLDSMKKQQLKFDVSSTILKAHPLNRVDVDDESHNGREILVVTRPALLAFEANEKGLAEHEFRILAKAIVLLGNRKE